jgi:hypothetical protein
MNPARKEAITLLLGCCDNEVPIRERTQDFGPNAEHQSSIEIAVDQRQHIGKARQIGAEFFSIFKRMALFVQADIERFVRRVNSQTETNDQEWCTSEGSPLRAGSKTNSRDARWQSRLRSHILQIDDGLSAAVSRHFNRDMAW